MPELWSPDEIDGHTVKDALMTSSQSGGTYGLSFREVSKTYGGSRLRPALENFSLEVTPGEIVGMGVLTMVMVTNLVHPPRVTIKGSLYTCHGTSKELPDI